MKKFRLEDYEGQYAMHVKTQEEYDTFSKFLYKNGKTWCDGYGYLVRSIWEINTSATCFNFNNGDYSYVNWLKREGYTILEFSDFDWDLCEFTKEQEVEVGFDGKDYFSDYKVNFYGYDDSLKQPYLVVDEDGNIENWKHCRAVQHKYKPYTKPDLKWLGMYLDDEEGDCHRISAVGLDYVVFEDGSIVYFEELLDYKFEGNPFGKEIK